MRITENLSKNFPWITVLTYVDKEYVGVVINQDPQVTTLYDWEMIRDFANDSVLWTWLKHGGGNQIDKSLLISL